MIQADEDDHPSLGSDEHRSMSYKPPNCSICEPDTIEPAIGFCKDCLYHLCDEYFRYHHRAGKENKSHKFVAGVDMPKKPVPDELKNVKCFDCRTDHPDIVCETHKRTLLCLNCASSTSHEKCKWRPIKQKLREIDIHVGLKRFEDKLTSMANTCVDEMRQTDDLLKEADKSKNDALLGVTELIKLLEAHLKELKIMKDKLYAQAQRDTQRLHQIKDFNAETLSKTQKMKEDIDIIKGNDYRAFLALQVAESCIKDLEAKTKQKNTKRPVPKYQFVPNVMFKTMIQSVDVAGQLIMSPSDKRQPPSPSDGSYVEYGLPRVVAIDDDAIAVIDKLHNCIRLFDPEGLRSTMLLSSFPWDLAVYRDNKIAVTHPKEQKISIYETKDGNIKVVEDLRFGFQCEGVSGFEDTLFITSTKPPGIAVVTTTQQGQHETKTLKIKGLMQPAYIDVSKDMICVSDRQTNKIFLMDWNGKQVKTFQNEHVKMPLTVCFCENSFVVVDCRSKMLHCINLDEKAFESENMFQVSDEEENEQLGKFWSLFELVC